jgi:prevent-host-death family protein
MRLLEKSEAVASLSAYVDQVDGDPLIITVSGKPVAALASLDGADAETISLGANPKFLSIIRRARRRHREDGGVSSEEVRRMFQGDR